MVCRLHPVILALALGCFDVTHGLAQAPGFTLHVDVPVVNIDVSVTDSDGRPVPNLDRSDFEVLDEGVGRQIQYFGASTAPYHTFLLIDVSGSTAHKWAFMRSAVGTFVAALRPQDQVRIGVFGEDLRILDGWSESGPTALAGLDSGFPSETPGRTTEFYWALEKVIDDAFDDIAERRAIIVLTDGRDVSTYQDLVRTNRLTAMENDDTFRALYRKAGRSGTSVYFVALNTDQNLEISPQGVDEYERLGILFGDSPIPERYLEQVRLRMETLAEGSGGAVYFPRSIADVAGPFRDIAESLSGAYSLGFVPGSGGGNAGSVHRIQVRVRSANLILRQSRNSYRVGSR